MVRFSFSPIGIGRSALLNSGLSMRCRSSATFWSSERDIRICTSLRTCGIGSANPSLLSAPCSAGTAKRSMSIERVPAVVYCLGTAMTV